MFDSEKFNGFIKSELDDLLYRDIANYQVFNESDLHSAAYYYIREYFYKRGSQNSEDILVRCEPKMEDGSKPDIVIFKRYDPVYVVELKMYKKPDFIHSAGVEKDLEKLNSYLKKYPSMKWGFAIVVYDSDEMFKPSAYNLKKAGYEKISFSTINLRRKQDTGRRRNGYDDWRKQFDKYLERHF